VSHVVQHFQPRKRAAAREFEVAVHYLLHDAGKLIPLMKQMAGNKWSGFIEDILNGARPCGSRLAGTSSVTVGVVHSVHDPVGRGGGRARPHP
jgi:hypothetical protein